jgi:nucleotide-binding universal stress UspA family protein
MSIGTSLARKENGKVEVVHVNLSMALVKKKPDIVVMGTVARTGLPGLLIGNTAENVLKLS